MMIYLPKINVPVDKEQVRFMNPLVLAFVGDAVQQLAIRTSLAVSSGERAGKLHLKTSAEVKATHQAKIIESIMGQLTEEEVTVYKTARNTKLNSIAKNASISEYRKATGYEALIGYLYLIGNNDRLDEIFSLSNKENLNNVES